VNVVPAVVPIVIDGPVRSPSVAARCASAGPARVPTTS